MQIKNIPRAAFRNDAAMAANGFELIPGYVSLYQNAGWPGLVFKKVLNAGQAALCGGVLAGFNVEAADWPKEEVLICDPYRERLLERRTSPVTDSGGILFEYDIEGQVQNKVAGGLSYYKVRLNQNGVRNPLGPRTVDYALAVVTPCYGIGQRYTGSVMTKTASLWSVYSGQAPALNMQTKVAGAPGWGTGVSFNVVRSWHLLWRELPFCPDAGKYISDQAEEIAKSYPTKIQDKMADTIKDMALGTQNIRRPAAFTLAYLNVGGVEKVGHIPRNEIDLTGYRYQTYRTDTAEPLSAAQNAANGLEYSWGSDEHAGWYTKSGDQMLRAYKPNLAFGVDPASLLGTWKLAKGFEVDTAKILRDFTPNKERTFTAGLTDWPALMKAGLLTGTVDAAPAVAAKGYNKTELIKPCAGPDIIVDIINVLALSEAEVMEESYVTTNKGEVFITGAWDAPTTPLPGGELEGGVPASLSGSTVMGRLIVGDGAITVKREGRYRAYLVGSGSAFKAVTLEGTAKAAAAATGYLMSQEVTLKPGDEVRVTSRVDFDAGYSMNVTDHNFVVGTLKKKIRSWVNNWEANIVFHPELAYGPLATSAGSYGTPGASVALPTPGRHAMLLIPVA